MNFLFRTFTLMSGPDSRRDDSACALDWLGGEAWVTPPPVSIESFGTPRASPGEAAAPDWIPL